MINKFTDHNSISLKQKLFKGNKGNGYWKLNTSILENKEYCKFIEKLITKYQHKFLDLICLPFVFSVYSLSSLLIVISSFCFNDVSSLYVLVLDNDKLKKYIENIKVHNKLSNNESEKCEGEITIEECTNAIFKMKLNSPRKKLYFFLLLRSILL
jgi:hypothetical protein